MDKEYYFNYRAFYEDPEGYQFTDDDIRYFDARELEEYEQTVPMTAPEKRALRKWVSQGHGVRECPPSKYICMPNSGRFDFLDVYRMDHEIAAAIRGKTRAEKEAYIKEYTGYLDPTPEELERMEAVKNTPVYVQRKYEKLFRRIFLLWDFLAEEGLWSEAKEYLEEHQDDEMPIEFSFILD